MLINEVKDEFLSYLIVERGDSKATIDNYSIDLDQFISFEENKDISLLKREDISDFINYLSSKGLKTSSIIRRSTVIRLFYIYLNKEKLIDVPLTGLYLPKNEKHLPSVLSTDEVDALLDCFDLTKEVEIRDKAMLETMYASGLRVS